MADGTSLTPPMAPSPGLIATLLSNRCWTLQSQRTGKCKNNNTISMYVETFSGRHTAQWQLLWSLNNLKRDPLEIQYPKFESNRLGFYWVCSWEIMADSFLLGYILSILDMTKYLAIPTSEAKLEMEPPFWKWAPSSEFVSSSIPSWQILTAHALPFRGARDLAFYLKVPLDSLLVWTSKGSGETARMRRLAWTFAARIGDKYQIRLTRSK